MFSEGGREQDGSSSSGILWGKRLTSPLQVQCHGLWFEWRSLPSI